MRHFQSILLVLLVVQMNQCTQSTPDYDLISTYQDETILELDIAVDDSTKVLIIMPHADDETIAGGLIAMLHNRGATLHLLTLCEHEELRVNELNCAASKLGIEKVEIAGFVNNSWDDIMQDNIVFWYDQQDSIKNVLARKIIEFKPDILITYDSEIGGYGHPEHRISAELTETLLLENKDNPEFTPKKIFQITLPEKLEAFLVSRSPGYEPAKQRTGSSGLPKPDVSVDIQAFWNTKNEAAQCHKSQMNILQRFYIAYDIKHAENHKKAFSKEYYRMIQI
jgi:N-acetylglucosamine malate deacetylase 2